MSEPRRRRRRRRRVNGATPAEEPRRTADAQPAVNKASRAPRLRRRRGRRGSGARKPPTPQTLEEVIAEINGGRPESLTAPPDGQKLEEVIGALQSVWGVPQYPQEYRITIKVAEERAGAPERELPRETANGVTRERAPAAPRVGPPPSGETPVKRERAPRRRRRVRRGRRRRGESN